MELLFNELSTSPCSIDNYHANAKMKEFVETVSSARKKGFKHIRSEKNTHEIELSENYFLSNWFHSKEVHRDLKDLMYGMIITPFIKDEDEDLINQYIEGNCYFEDLESGYPKTKCEGLMSAHLYQTLSISLLSAPVWSKSIFSLIIEKDGQSSSVNVFNISSPESIELPLISEFIEDATPVQIITTDILPKDKKVHLADHHGKAELKALTDQLKNSPYIIEFLSCAWGGKRFIRKAHSNGGIEIVLYSSEREYALLVKSTGRNLRETEKIAKLLKERYDR